MRWWVAALCAYRAVPVVVSPFHLVSAWPPSLRVPVSLSPPPPPAVSARSGLTPTRSGANSALIRAHPLSFIFIPSRLRSGFTLVPARSWLSLLVHAHPRLSAPGPRLFLLVPTRLHLALLVCLNSHSFAIA
jgi:hypothetical protein